MLEINVTVSNYCLQVSTVLELDPNASTGSALILGFVWLTPLIKSKIGRFKVRQTDPMKELRRGNTNLIITNEFSSTFRGFYLNRATFGFMHS